MISSDQQVCIILIGLGNVGRRVLELFERKGDLLRARYRLNLVLVGAADTSGAAWSDAGLDVQQVIRLKQNKHGVAAYSSAGHSGMSALELVERADGDLLIEASPVNLQTGEPGLSCIRTALTKGLHVVTANKGPLVLAYQELMRRADSKRVKLLFSASVAGGLPTVNIGRRDLVGSEILKLEGILNGTTNLVLTRMAEEGWSFGDALAEAQRLGHAEADPRLDTEGWDAANKLVILANCALHYPATLKNVEVEGITRITSAELQRAKSQGKVIKLIAKAEKVGDTYRLSVKPTALDASHPLARLGAHHMGIIYHTDINGTIFAEIEERDPMPTAAAVLRDVITVYRA